MMKRILSFLLALLMVVSIFPAQVFATDNTDVTITQTETPTEEATEIATETACPTCGTVGCTSEHLTWCPDCKVDDCGKTHVFCEICQKNDCGQNHCPTCGTIDCIKEHKECDKCGTMDCTADHTNWCEICKFDNCDKDHNATEPTESATEPVAPIDEGDEEETDPMVGKVVTLNTSDATIYAYSNPPSIAAFTGAYAFPEQLKVTNVKVVDEKTYYQLVPADGYSWPDNSNLVDGYYYDSTKFAVVEEEKKECPICGETDCTTEHKKCEICEEYDCIKIHFWCELCEKHDCSKSHLICPACGEVDCTKTHTWCGHCGGYDCGIEHVDEYKPDTTPVIPENPTMTPNAEVSIVDEYGDAVTEDGLFLIEGMKSSISAWPAGGADSYQWQVRYNNANDLWADIQGETGRGILVSPAMFMGVIDHQGSTAIRCVATSGAETKVSAAIPVIVEEAVPMEKVAMFAAAPRSGSTGDATATAETGDGVKYSIIIEFKFPNGDTAAQAWTASLSAGADYVLDVECPDVVGYKPDRERITETITAISGNMTYTVTYTPDYVDYKVVHHQQNIGDNNYTAVKTETKTGLTGSPVGTGLETEYDGFYDLIYDPEIAVAADGSTVINIYYDRYYYLVSLDLNGGFGVEPIYARYGTYINSAAWVPQRTGYAFSGWSPALPAAVPLNGSSHIAQWANADTGFTVAFWYENANDTDYTFVGSVQQTAVTGTKVNGESYKDEQYSDYNADYAKHFTYSHADSDVEIQADGSTVVNVYFSRNTYTLTYYKWKCLHTHTNACCSLQHIHNQTAGACCSLTAHTHGTGCISNLGSKANSDNQDLLNGDFPNARNGDVGYKEIKIGSWVIDTYYYVYMNGSWYNLSGTASSVSWSSSCPRYEHTHGSGCNTSKCGITAHDHSSGRLSTCNSSACTHSAHHGCESDISNMNHWTVFYQGTFKYEQDVSAIHAAQGAERWCPGACEGLKRDDGTYYPSYGQSPAHGVYSSMGGGNVDFYQGSAGANEYKLTFWLETYDGSGSRTYNGKNFAQGTTFTAKMGAVGYWGDYDAGCPAGFDTYEAWTADSLAGSNGTQLKVDETIAGSTYLYYNFYYIRKSFTLTYFNGSNVAETSSMMYDEPLTSDYNLQNLPLISPYGSGYYFAGWYLDADCTVPVSWGSTRMPDGGMAVYAKWAPLTHTVTTYQTKGGTKLGTYTTVHGTTVENAPEDPTRDGYNFVSWFYEEDGIEKAYNFSMPVNKDLELYAVWTSDSLASGTVSYMIEGTSTRIAEDTPISGLVGASKTYNAKISTELNSGYQTGYFPATSSHNVLFSATTSQNNWIFYYKKMDDVAYTVRYVNKDTGAELMEATTGTSNAGKITVTHKPYTGYAADAYSKDLVLSSDPALNVVTFYYTKDDVHAPVQVEHYIQNTAGTGYTLYFSEQPYNGTIGQTQIATPLNLTGFTHNSRISINGRELTASGLVLKLYYDRNTNNYTFRFMVEGTTTELRPAVTGSGLYGAQVSQVAPVIPGYDLTSSGSLTVTIGTDDSTNVRTFYYEEDEVTIRYQVGSVKGGAVSRDSETVLAVTGTPAGSTAAANTDYVFKGWYTKFDCTGTAVSENAAFVPAKNSNGVYEKETYYAKFEEGKVTINYKIDGPDGSAELSSKSEQVSVLTGKAVGSTVTVADKYEFAGWFDSEGNEVGDAETFIPTKSGDKWVDGTTYTAKIVEKKATINYVAVGSGTVTPTTEKVDMLTGSAAGSAAAASANISTFVGWYYNEDCTGTALSTEQEFAPDMPSGGWAETQTYYAKFENNQYTISFDTNGGTPKTVAPITYAYGGTLTLPEVTNGNYIVTWTVKEATGDWVKDAEVGNGTINHYGDVTLVANWTINAIWIDWDFNILTSKEEDILEIDENVAYGAEHTYNGEAPTRDATAQYSYTFKEWAEEDLSSYETLLGDELNGVVVYRAVYEATINTYTITWKNEDGTTIDTTEVEYGKIPTHDGPAKDATTEYTYTFAGWTPEVVAVTGDATYKATFTETKRNYNITWLNDDDSVIDTTTVEYGKVPTHADPSKAATAEYTYTFAGWTPEVVAVTGEATYKAIYTAEKNKYTVTWKNEDGTVLETDTVEYGATPSYDGETPTKDTNNQYTYIFRAWSPEIVPVTGDATYTAAFDSHENFYTVTWLNHDGTVLETDENVKWDTMPEYNGDTPEKAGNAEHSYSFAGWSPTVSKVNGHAIYTATFAESVNTYTVTWKNEDGNVLETDENVTYGTLPSYDGETPEKAATAQYTYTFDGWDKEVVAVTGDVTYTAKFSATVNKYTVTFVDEDGTTILKEATEYEYGTAAEDIVKPANPTKEANAEFTYTFAGWTPEIAEVTANVTYKATYTEVKNQYTLSGEIDHGTATNSVTVEYGTMATITFTPATGYKFQSYTVNGGSATSITASEGTWSYEEQQLTENKRVVVTTAPIEYTITYYLRDGNLGEGITNPGAYTVETETFALNNPTKAGYKFVGWATSENADTGNETVTIEKGTTGDKTFYAIWERSLVDLTIKTTTADTNQNFVFTVSGTRSDGVAFASIDVVLCSENGFTVTIKDLPVGTYIVTEKDGWSWREDAVENKTADLRTTSQTVSFDFYAVDDLHWLSGYSYKRKKGGS